jgi:hypothetical protein
MKSWRNENQPSQYLKRQSELIIIIFFNIWRGIQWFYKGILGNGQIHVPLFKEYEGSQPDGVEELPIYHPYGKAKPYNSWCYSLQ